MPKLSESITVPLWWFPCIVAASTACAPAKPPDPLEILKRANQAATKLTAVSYEATFSAEGALADQATTMDGKVLAARGPIGDQPSFRIDGRIIRSGGKENAQFQLAFDGKNLYNLDQTARFFSDGPLDPGILVSNPLFQPKYVHDSPFREELKDRNVEYLGVEEVEGVPCDVVRLKAASPYTQSTKLFIGQQDSLLRRSETTPPASAPPGSNPPYRSLIFTAKNLTANPPVDGGLFRLSCPEGFTRAPLKTAQAPGGDPALLPTGSEAPDWELKTPQGNTVSLKSLRGKVVVLDFWATWCGPCKMAMPSLQKLHEKFKDKPAAIFGVNCRERVPNQEPVAYIKKQGFTYGQLLNGDAVANAYRVTGIPCIYVIGPDGKILQAVSGFNPMLEQYLGGMIEKAMVPRQPSG